MSLRAQPPVHSPLTASALLRGVRCSILGSQQADRELRTLVETAFAPQEALFTDSGTTALRLALEGAQRLKAGPVAIPAYSCYDVATAAVGADVPVLLYDVDPTTLGPVVDSLSRALAAGASTAVVAHLYGIPVEMRAVLGVVGKHGAILVEDAAQGSGASYDDRRIGSLGPLSVLSFGRGKGLTGGGGGALLANDELGAEALRAVQRRLERRSGWIEIGKAAAQWACARPALYRFPRSLPFLGLGETMYRESWEPGGLPAAVAGILSGVWPHAEREASARRARAAHLRAELGGLPGLHLIHAPSSGQPGYLRLPARNLWSRNASLPTPLRDFGVAPGYPQPLGWLPGLRDRVLNPDEPLPGATELVERLFTLPTHSLLTDGDVERLTRGIEGWLGAGR